MSATDDRAAARLATEQRSQMQDLPWLEDEPDARAPDGAPAALMSRLLARVAEARGPRSVESLFAAFLAVPAQAAVDVALALSRSFAAIGVGLLSAEQRAALVHKVSRGALVLAQDLVWALRRLPQVEAATGVTAAALQRQMEQQEELLGLRAGLELARDEANDARRQLQAWQFEAQRRVTHELCRQFLAADDVAARVRLVADAGPVLDLLFVQLRELRRTRAEGKAIVEAQAAELARLENELLMVKTMQAVRDGRPVDEAVLKRAAMYYAERNAPKKPAAEPKKPAAEPKKPAAEPKKPAAEPKKPPGRRRAGRSKP